MPPIDLSRNSNLRSLRLTIEEDTGVLPWLADVLSTISSPNLLERVAIEIFIAPHKLEGWEQIDTVLSRPEFSSLCQVDVGIFAIPAEFLAVEGKLTALHTRQILSMYQLWRKGKRLSSSLTPMISSYEDQDSN